MTRQIENPDHEREKASEASQPEKPAVGGEAEPSSTPRNIASSNDGQADEAAGSVAEKDAEASSDKDRGTDDSPRPASERRRFFGRGTLRGASGFLTSMILHMALLITLALWMLPEVLPDTTTAMVVDPMTQPEEELQTVELDDSLVAAEELTYTIAATNPAENAPVDVTDPELRKAVVEESLQSEKIALDTSLGQFAASPSILQALPQGAMGKARAVSDNYQHAMDRITQEIIWMLDDQKVLVIWLFDQSESMKDDQKEIRGKIERVYKELGLSGKSEGDALVTAVCSYGAEFAVHTKKPTSDLEKIRAAIDAIPNDKSGEEIMCQAVGLAINRHRKFASSGGRKLAMIMVTDESGNREGNVRYLEQAIKEAKSARCTVFILGREAVFGYPYAFMRWRHPQTGRPHWLRIDRGPETAFVEQIQTDGFHRRYDAYPSGFGPYEQSRLAHQTGGIFFMLPSVETKLVRGEKRRYELDAMVGYKPDLRSREAIFKDRKSSKLQTTLWSVISTLNPYNKNAAEVVELRIHFSPDFQKFCSQVAKEQAKAKILLPEFARQQKILEKIKRLRLEEPTPRWQANYDLLYAQLIAYQARVYEYGAYLDEFMKKPPKVPLKKPPNLGLTYWDIGCRKKTLTGETIKPYVEQANKLFAALAKEHPGTPWAARAQWELKRGYGVTLHPRYEPPYKKVTNPIPLPKY